MINTINKEQNNYGIIKQLGFVNTQYFREAAIYFEKHKRYPDGDVGTLEWERYWDEEEHRVLNGYEVGGESITGEHYLYLNYLPIMKIPNKYRNLSETELKRINAPKVEGFPDFWDEDYVIYKSYEIAEKGITIEELDSLPINIPLERDADNLGGGHHHLWLKPRGVGASYKGASRPILKQFFHYRSATFIIANLSDYLNDDGIFTKYQYYKNWLNSKASGFSRNFSINQGSDLHFRSSYWVIGEESGVREERGKMSDVYGVILDNNPNKARGKRGDILWEEFGSNPIVDTAWEQAQNSVEEDGYVYGTMRGFGTGGDDKGGMIPMSKMFYDPKPYNLLRYKNIWDNGYNLGNTLPATAFFTPAYRSISYKDENGNSDEVRGKAYFDSIREEKQKAKDPTVLPKHQAEKPYTPKEALRSVGTNHFNVEELDTWLKKIEITGIDKDIVKRGRLKVHGPGKVEFEADYNAQPYDEYPVDISSPFIEGCVSILHFPYRQGGDKPEKYLYRICVDTYRHDVTTGDSVGAIYVIENTNKITPYKGDKIVAWYRGRPKKQDTFNEIVFALGTMYNAEIGFENDEPGDLVGFAKRKRIEGYNYMSLLATEFELAYDDKLKGTNTRGFGLRLNSGPNNLRKLQGDKFIQEWLKVPRANGSENYETIYCKGLLRELISYTTSGNFDSVSAIRVGMFHEREYLYKGIKPEHKAKDNFFERDLFGGL